MTDQHELDVRRLTSEAEKGHGCEVMDHMDKMELDVNQRAHLLSEIVELNKKNRQEDPSLVRLNLEEYYGRTTLLSNGYRVTNLNFDGGAWYSPDRPLYGQKFFPGNGELRTACRLNDSFIHNAEERKAIERRSTHKKK